MLRIGLGCMRLATEADAEATIEAALDAGIEIFDTARAYGESERWIGRILAGRRARVITKGGMRRDGGAWIPDGRAGALRADCEASLAALDGVPIELYLLHAPDPRTSWKTSVRALAALVDAGLVSRVGVCNVNRRQLDEAVELAPIAAVQVALSPFDLEALRGGVVERCAELGIELYAHSPLGGPARAAKLEPREAQLALAWAIDLDPCVIPLPGATRPETARLCAEAARLRLSDEDRARFPAPNLRPPAVFDEEGEVVMVMGIPGAGKTEAVARWVDRGYERLNRDERGGTLRALRGLLDERLAAGARRVVLDNTYVTRASRREVIEVAWRHALRVRGVWLDTPLADAQVNAVWRMLARHGRLLEPEELKRSRDPSAIPPQAQFRMVRELEPPDAGEGFSSLELVPFVRRPRPGRPARIVAIEALRRGDEADLVLAWRPGGSAAAVADEARALGVASDVALCAHPGGPPICWCRPPLPGLPVAYAWANGLDLGASVLVGTGPAHRALAAAIGARYEAR